MGLTEKGYTRRTYNDIIQEATDLAKKLFGDDIDTSELTALGKFIRIFSYSIAVAEEEIEAVYYSSKPNSATGQSLDRLLFFGGISRNPATPSKYNVGFTGTAGYTIPAGFLVGTELSHTFATVEDVTISDEGACDAVVRCTEAGTIGNVRPDTIVKIVNPDANVTAVQGWGSVEAGLDEENDTDLRARLKAAMQGTGSCNENSLRAALLRIPTVQFAAVVTNDGDTADSDGRPPHSFECYVRGGDQYEQEIAEAIFDKKPIGIKTAGSKSVTVVDLSGTEQIIKYSPTRNVDVAVKATIKTTNTFPEDGEERIKEAVAGHINSLGIGNSLILSSIYGHIYGVPGVAEVSSLTLATNGSASYTQSNVTIAQYELAVCGNIELTIEVIA